MIPEEINKAVARKLGWKPSINKKLDRGVWKKTGKEDIPYRLLPDYCRDIKAAWEIVEKMQETHRIKIEYLLNECQCQIGDDYADADTAPMAITLAFLKLEGEK